MRRYTFNRGIFEDGSPLPEWRDSEDFEDYLARIDYLAGKTSFGSEFGGQLHIYESSSHTSFYANVSPSGSTEYDVFLPDLPSMMMFIKDYGGVFSAASANDAQQEVLQLLEKFFQAEHGHAAHSICEQCDPEAWAENIRRNEERRRSRKATG